MIRTRKLSGPILRIFLILLCSGLLAFQPASVASAHANLVRSNPDRGAVLAKAPTAITLKFSESLDPQLSQVQLLDSHGKVIVVGPGTIDPASPLVMTLALPALPDGAYTAIWQTHSAADGHFANGSVSFSVGSSASNVSLLPAETTPLPTQATPALPDVLLRWLGYLAAALVGGGIFFGLLVWRPAFRALPGAEAETDQQTARLLKKQVTLGAILLAAATLLGVGYQALTASSGSSSLSFGAALLSLASFDGSWQLWIRFFILVFIVVLIGQLPPPGRSPLALWLVMAPLVVVLLATFSLKSHSAALDTPIPIVTDIIHLTAMSAWFGGLPLLFLLLRRNALPPSLLVPRFTRVALTSVSILALTGVYSALVEVQTLNALSTTSYGFTLLIKVGLFALLVGLGALNFLVLTPRFHKDEANTTRRLRNSIRVELILGVFLLAAVGVLAGASPSYQAVQATQQLGVVGEYTQNGINMRLWLAPGISGVNEVAVDVSGLQQDPSQGSAQVLLRFQNLDTNIGITQAEAKTGDQKRYQVRGSYFNLAGSWSIQAILRRSGQYDITHTFTVSVQTDPNDTNPNNPVPVTPDSLADGKALYQSNCVLCHGVSGKGDGPAGRALNPPPADLTYHTIPGVHTDGQLFYWISQGLPRTAMPHFAITLNEKQRWDLVNFIRTLAKPATK